MKVCHFIFITILFLISMYLINNTRLFVGLMFFGWMLNLENYWRR